MGNEHTSRIVQAPGIETNQGESARPPIVRYNIWDEDIELFTEEPRSASYRFPPPNQAEVFRTPVECHRRSGMIVNVNATICVAIRPPVV